MQVQEHILSNRRRVEFKLSRKEGGGERGGARASSAPLPRTQTTRNASKPHRNKDWPKQTFIQW